MKKLKQFISLMLAVLMLMTVAPLAVTASAESYSGNLVKDGKGNWMEKYSISFEVTKREKASATLNIKWTQTIFANYYETQKYVVEIKCAGKTTGKVTVLPANTWPSASPSARSKTTSMTLTVPVSTTGSTTLTASGTVYQYSATGKFIGSDTGIPGSRKVSIPAYIAPANTYTVTYNANGGTGAPASQTKTENVALTLSSSKPTRSGYTFKGWAASSTATTAQYQAGGTYTDNAAVTLYAVWEKNPDKTYTVSYSANGGTGAPANQTKTENVALTLSTTKPTRSGYTFKGWATSSTSSTVAYQPGASYTGNANLDLYAVWSKNEAVNIYNHGEETYSFNNFSGDSDGPYGHCFGMSLTSAAYYLGLLDIGIIGCNDVRKLHTLSKTTTVTKPICYYQARQGGLLSKCLVAGSIFRANPNTTNDWNSVVNYVKNHSYDNKGELIVSTVNVKNAGHAVVFLYYKEVNGEQRIYVYDSSQPGQECYYYKDSSGYIKEAPRATLSSVVEIGLHSVRKYMSNVSTFNMGRAVYAYEGDITIEGAECTPMISEAENDKVFCVYTLPDETTSVKIIPNVENAEFEYYDCTYSFGNVEKDDIKYGLLSFATDSLSGIDDSSFVVVTDNNQNTNARIKNFDKYNDKQIDYKSTITFYPENVSAESVVWSINGANYTENADGSCTVNQATNDFTVCYHAQDSSGHFVQSEIETVHVKTGIFAKIAAFFKGLFGKLPVLYQ